MRPRAFALFLLTAPLICAGCHREETAPRMDTTAACGSDVTLAQLKQSLLPPQDHPGRRYLQRAQAARITLSDITLTGYDQSTGTAHCQATAHLISPPVQSDPLAVQQISYTSQQQPDGSVRISSPHALEDGGLDQFPKLLRQKPTLSPPAHVASSARPPVDADSATAPSTGPAANLSDEAQRLVDQAGDTRPASDNRTDGNTVSAISNSTS